MTITSNIYTNLAGWSNATYIVGALRQNAGNAYVCSVAGTSTSPPTGTGTNIAPGGTSRWNYISSVDYTTLQAWADAIVTPLTQPVVGVWDDGGGVLSYAFGSGAPLLWLQGHTTTTTNTITLQPRSGRGFKDKYAATPVTAYTYSSANGLAISTPASGTTVLGLNLIQVDDNNINLIGLQFIETNGSSNMSLIGGIGANLHISQCIIDGITQAAGATLVDVTGTGFLMSNTLVVDRVPSGLTSATLKSFGTGSVFVNNAVICINNVSTMSAVDAGTNPSSGSSFAVNNIFVGYGSGIFISQTGAIWATHNNAYTNAAFGTSGTDSGGSIYNITPSAVFVSATTDFHITTGSVANNSGATDTTDLPSAVDFVGTSRPQGTNWDMGPHELLAGSVILRDFLMSVDTKITRSVDNINPVEWSVGRRLPIGDSPMSIEFRGSVIVDRAFRQEFLASWPLNAASSGFSSGFSTGFGPLNQIFTTNPALVSPIEWRVAQGNLIQSANFPLEWGVRIQKDSLTSIEWRGVVLFTGTFPIDWSAPIVTRDAVLFTDWGRATNRSIATSVEHSSQITLSSIVPTEWNGFTGVVVDGIVPIEFLTTRRRDSITPVEYRSPAVTTDSQVSIDFLSTTQAQFTLSMENLTTRVVSPVLLTEWTAPVNISTTSLAEYGQSAVLISISNLENRSSIFLDTVVAVANSITALLDASPPLSEEAGRQADASIPVDYSAGSISAGTAFPIFVEWRSTIQADLVSRIASVHNIQEDVSSSLENLTRRVGDAIALVEWSLSIVMDSVSSVEWSHLLTTRNVDGTFPLSYSSVVVTEVTMFIDLDLGREAYGAQLTPDEWEFEHKP